MVVDLDHQVGTFLNGKRKLRVARRLDLPRRPSGDDPGRGDARSAETGIAAVGGTGRKPAGGAAFIHVNHAVVHHAPVSGAEFGGEKVRVLLQIQRNHEADELVGAVGGNGVAVTHGDHLV